MPTQQIHVVKEAGSLNDAFEALAKLQKTLNYLLNGNLDVENIRAKSLTAEVIEAGSITAEEMTVSELSAITANLGHITAGLIEAVDIFGSYIATSQNSYPRAEMSSDLNMFRASMSPTKYVSIEGYSSTSGSPELSWTDGSDASSSYVSGGKFFIGSAPTMEIGSTVKIVLRSFGDIELQAFGDVVFTNWSSVVSGSTGMSLQDELDSKANYFSGYSGSFANGDGKTVFVSNGIVTAVV